MEKLQKVLDSLVSDGATGVLLDWRSPEGRWTGVSGVAERASGQPVDPAGWFRAGSITKTFTAVVVLQLVAEGQLRLDEPVTQWLPGVPEDVTLRQLLNHTSGLYNYTDDLPDTAKLYQDRYDHWDPAETLAGAVAKPRGSGDWAYSNTNYVALGLLIEAVTGRSYEDEVRSRVLEPVGLTRTLLPGDDVDLPDPQLHAYLEVEGELVDLAQANVSQAWAAGQLVSTAADLNRFYAAVLGGELLGADELVAMLTGVPNGDGTAYGLGIAHETLPDGRVLWGHTGGIFGYRTVSYHSLDLSHQVTLAVGGGGGGEPETGPVLADLFEG
ncbi:serine hydrolase domain-containing protein [Kribbella lupini]|uniref:Serine hydrolase domain-containing protein n=1 Tax=Kribbella lupini TaxID=291602 RepID=A0ABN2AD10_9ACTN